jgi:hypothetical protein
MIEKHCETDCREDLLMKLNERIHMDGVWKFVGVLIAVLTIVWGAAFTIHADGDARLANKVETAEKQIAANTITITKLMEHLEQLKEGQDKLERKLESLGTAIIKEVKKNR